MDQESKFYQNVVMAIVIGVISIIFILFGLEKSGTYDEKVAPKTATKNSETLEVRGPFTKYVKRTIVCYKNASIQFFY